MIHGFKHIAQIPAALGLDLCAPGFLKLEAQFVLLDVLKASETIRDRAHVAAALDVVLPAQRIYATAVAANVPGENCKVDEGNDVVHSVVVFGDSESPANLRARSAGVGMSHLADGRGRNPSLAFSSLQCVFLNMRLVSLKSAGGVLDEFLVSKSGGDDFPTYGVGERNVRTDVQTQPEISPARGTGTPRVNHIKFSAIVDTL